MHQSIVLIFRGDICASHTRKGGGIVRPDTHNYFLLVKPRRERSCLRNFKGQGIAHIWVTRRRVLTGVDAYVYGTT